MLQNQARRYRNMDNEVAMSQILCFRVSALRNILLSRILLEARRCGCRITPSSTLRGLSGRPSVGAGNVWLSAGEVSKESGEEWVVIGSSSDGSLLTIRLS